MPYFIFNKNQEDISGTFYRMAENESDLNNLNIEITNYNIIQESLENFNNVKFQIKFPISYNISNVINYENLNPLFTRKENLEKIVNNLKQQINLFLKNNQNHPLFDRWNSYYNQLNSLDLETINYPLTMSLEQYFNNLGQPSYSVLQLP
jgi:mRNA-degrading endonuclease YafQ of YafQ-DinJ toxin-antitoxin module